MGRSAREDAGRRGVSGIAYWDGKSYTGIIDGRVIAPDAKSGKGVRAVDTSEGPDDGRTNTGAPWVLDGKVAITHVGSNIPAFRGFVITYDARMGRLWWCTYPVPANPLMDRDKTARIAAKSWTSEWWKWGGGGTARNRLAYDPKHHRLYIGAGNDTPWYNRHGAMKTSGCLEPDLRQSDVSIDPAALLAVVRKGSHRINGMSLFPQLDDAVLENLPT